MENQVKKEPRAKGNQWWNIPHFWDYAYDKDIVQFYVSLVPFVNKLFGTDYVVPQYWQELFELVSKRPCVYHNVYHNKGCVVGRVSKFGWKGEERTYEVVTAVGAFCEVIKGYYTKQELFDIVESLANFLESHPRLFAESYDRLMNQYDIRICVNYQEILQNIIDWYKPLLTKDELLKGVADGSSLALKNSTFMGLELRYE